MSTTLRTDGRSYRAETTASILRERSRSASRRVACPLCGSQENHTLYERHGRNGEAFAAEMTTDVFSAYGRIATCNECSLAFRDPREADSDILESYATLEDGCYLGERECRGMNALLSLKAVRSHLAGGRLLEIGCSTGLFLNAARLDFDVVGVEPSLWAAAIARERFGLAVHAGPLETFDEAPRSFDAVAMIDVIEHLVDPRDACTRIASLLRSDGLLYLVTPDLGSLSARLLRGYWWGLRPAHLTYFSRATLTRLLREVGFELVEVRSFGRIFTYGYWLSRLEKYPVLVRRPAAALVHATGWRDKVLYLDTRDSMQVVARRR